MRRLIFVISICLLVFPAYCQSTSKYEVGTITEVKPHQPPNQIGSEVASYDVSVKVGDMIYVVLYTPAMDEITPKYIAGRELLVLVGKKTITYNNMLGQSFEVPIESQKLAAKLKQSK